MRNVDAGNTATVNIIDKPNGNYTVTGSETFVIEKADIEFKPLVKGIEGEGEPRRLRGGDDFCLLLLNLKRFCNRGPGDSQLHRRGSPEREGDDCQKAGESHN